MKSTIEKIEQSLISEVKSIHINAMKYALSVGDNTTKKVKVLDQSDLKHFDHDYFYFQEKGFVYRVSWENLENDIHQICGLDCRECGDLSDCMGQIWEYYNAYADYIKKELNQDISTHISMCIENNRKEPVKMQENVKQPIMWPEDGLTPIEYGVQ